MAKKSKADDFIDPVFDETQDTEDSDENEYPDIDPDEIEKSMSGVTKASDKPSKKAKQNIEEKILTSEYGSNVVKEKDAEEAKNLLDDLTSFLSKETKSDPSSGITSTIPTGIDLLDAVLGGGVCTSLTQFVGMPGSGKSTLASKVIATGQRKWPGKFISVYIDSEESMTTDRLSELGIIYPKIKPYRENKIESVFKIIEAICAYKESNPELIDIPSIIVWDSIANTIPEKALSVENVSQVLGLKAAMLSFLLPKYVNKINRYNIALIGINQMRDKIDMGGPYSKTPSVLRFLPNNSIPGGLSLQHNTTQLFWCRQSSMIDEDVYGFECIKVVGKLVKNKLFTPNIDIELVYSFSKGFTNFWTNYELLKKFKRINVGGGWVKLNGYDSDTKFRQKEAIFRYQDDEKFKKAWDENVKDVIQKEYIDKYKPKETTNEEVW